MSESRLRIFSGSDDNVQPEAPSNKQAESAPGGREANQNMTVKVSLRHILPLLLDASLCDRTWLTDFLDDEIAISADLFDVMESYREYRNRVA